MNPSALAPPAGIAGTDARRCDASETAALLDAVALVDAIRRAAVELEEGRIVCPERQVVPLAEGATMLSMPAVADDVAIHKLITVAPGNRARGLPTIQGAMTVFEPSTGRPLLVLDGPTVTARRTAAVSLCAIDALALRGASMVLVIGTGSQARHHVEALVASHRGWRVRVRGTSRASERAFCADVARSCFDAIDLAPAADDDADVAITCTSSAVPVYAHPARSDTLVVAVGSFSPEAAEVAASTVRASAIYVDDPHGARAEAGDLIQADVDWADVVGLGRLLRDGPSHGARPVLFKSVGCAAWDLAAARVALAAQGGGA